MAMAFTLGAAIWPRPGAIWKRWSSCSLANWTCGDSHHEPTAMSRLRVFHDAGGEIPLHTFDDHAQIARELGKVGVRFERWQASQPIEPGDPPEKVIAAYRPDIERLQGEHGYKAVDVISLTADHPQKDALRQKFLNEHTHSEDEVRFFVAGEGLFTLHIH